MSPHHSDQMSQRSQVSRVALWMTISKVLSDWVTESVTRSPIELFWTAKKDICNLFSIVLMWLWYDFLNLVFANKSRFSENQAGAVWAEVGEVGRGVIGFTLQVLQETRKQRLKFLEDHNFTQTKGLHPATNKSETRQEINDSKQQEEKSNIIIFRKSHFQSFLQRASQKLLCAQKLFDFNTFQEQNLKSTKKCWGNSVCKKKRLNIFFSNDVKTRISILDTYSTGIERSPGIWPTHMIPGWGGHRRAN